MNTIIVCHNYSMKFSSKTKFKLNKLGKNSSNSCNQQMSPYYIHIVTYKLGGS